MSDFDDNSIQLEPHQSAHNHQSTFDGELKTFQTRKESQH